MNNKNSKYFIRTNDFFEIVYNFDNKKNIYIVREFTGHYYSMGLGETKLLLEKSFDNEKSQLDYINKRENEILNRGYIHCIKSFLISIYDKNNNIKEIYYDDDFEITNKILINKLETLKEYEKKHISIEFWGVTFNENEKGIDFILNYFIENKSKYVNTEYFTIGNVNRTICELSWIIQGNYEKFFKAFPNIKGMFIQGNEELKLRKMNLPKLEILELQGSSLRNEILEDITNSNLPNLKRLNLYFGVEYYGCDVEIKYVKNLLENTNFENLKILGLCNMEALIISEVITILFNSKYIYQIEVLDISKSGIRDIDAEIIINNIDKLKNIRYIDIHYNYFSDDMIEKLYNLAKEYNFEINLDCCQGDLSEDIFLEEYEDEEEFLEEFSPMYME